MQLFFSNALLNWALNFDFHHLVELNFDWFELSKWNNIFFSWDNMVFLSLIFSSFWLLSNFASLISFPADFTLGKKFFSQMLIFLSFNYFILNHRIKCNLVSDTFLVLHKSVPSLLFANMRGEGLQRWTKPFGILNLVTRRPLVILDLFQRKIF